MDIAKITVNGVVVPNELKNDLGEFSPKILDVIYDYVYPMLAQNIVIFDIRVDDKPLTYLHMNAKRIAFSMEKATAILFETHEMPDMYIHSCEAIRKGLHFTSRYMVHERMKILENLATALKNI